MMVIFVGVRKCTKFKQWLNELATCMDTVSKNIMRLDSPLKKLISSTLECFEKFHHLHLEKPRREQDGRVYLNLLKRWSARRERKCSTQSENTFTKPTEACGREKVSSLDSASSREAFWKEEGAWADLQTFGEASQERGDHRAIWNWKVEFSTRSSVSPSLGLAKPVCHRCFDAVFFLIECIAGSDALRASFQRETVIRRGLKAYKNLLELSHHRILLILENFNSEDLTSYFTVPQCDHVSLIIVTRQPDKVFTKRQQGMMHLNIELPHFSSAESAECLAELTGKETPLEVLEMHKLILSHLNNFPLAVQVAKALLRNFTSECVAKYHAFYEEYSHSSMDPTEMIGLASSSENASVISSLISFALSIIQNQQDVQALVYLTALLACPSVPNLPSLPEVEIKTEESLFKLEQLGFVVEEHYDKGEQPSFQMHALVASTLLSKMLTLPFDECLTHLLQGLRILSKCLSGEEKLDMVSQEKVAFSAMCLEHEGTLNRFIENLSEKNTASDFGRSVLLFYYGEFLFDLAMFSGSIWETSHPRFAVNPALAFDLFEKSLHIFSFLNQKGNFCRMFDVYEDILRKYELRQIAPEE